MPLSLADALTGTTATVAGIDGREIRIPLVSVITPTTQLVVPHEGMPIRGVSPSASGAPKRGNLLVRFKILFPQAKPSGELASSLRAALGTK